MKKTIALLFLSAFIFTQCSKNSPTPKYTVTFNTNDVNTVVATQTVNSGATATKPTNPKRIGYVLNDWYTDSNFIVPFNFATKITENTTVYAKWTPVATYTVTFNTFDVNTVVATQTINTGDMPTKPNDPTRTGYTFNGWYKEAAFSNVFDYTTPITANTTVYVKWFANIVTTLAGDGTPAFLDGIATVAQFQNPYGVAVDGSGNVYVADTYNNRIRKIDTKRMVSTLSGNGTTTEFFLPYGIASDASNNVYVADQNNNRIQAITSTNIVKTLAGGTYGSTDGTGATAQFSSPAGVAVDAVGTVYVTDYRGNTIRTITPKGVVTTLAGDGTYAFAEGLGKSAKFNSPSGVAVDAIGNIYVADQLNHRIRKITPAGLVSTLAGDGTKSFKDGAGTSAQFNSPSGVAVDGRGNIYVADTGNHRIRLVTPAGVVTTLAGGFANGDNSTNGLKNDTGTNAQFDTPNGIAIDANGNVYVADTNNNRIRKIQTKP